MNKKAQGALEYLMLIAASVVVVAVVISFISGSMNPIIIAGNQHEYDYICNVLKTQDFKCGCYTCDATRTGVNPQTGTKDTPDETLCKDLAEYLDEPLLGGCRESDFKN